MTLKPLNNKGMALITSYMVLVSLITLAGGLTISSISELNNARRHRDATAAFWAAEAGIQRFLTDTTLLDATGQTDFSIGSFSVHLEKDDSDSTTRIVTATGTAGSIQRSIRVEFPSLPPDVFDNTISTGGNFRSWGGSIRTSTLNVHDKTRLGGVYDNDAWNLDSNFDDKLENQNTSSTTLTYPDADGNGTANQFNDFVEFNRDVVASYPPEDVVYITPNPGETVVIYPKNTWTGDGYTNESLVNKKIIYIEGTTAGEGDVNILFDASNWADNQNLTVISTGTVTYVQPLQGVTDNSRLNVIAWDDYAQGSVLVSRHDGTIYAHDDAFFTDVLSSSQTTGNVIANDLIQFTEFLQTTKDFIYSDPVINGAVPPGFEGLVGNGGGGYSSTPSSWKEM